MPSGKERKAMQDNLHTHHSNMKTGKSGTGNKVKSVSPNKAVNNANPNNKEGKGYIIKNTNPITGKPSTTPMTYDTAYGDYIYKQKGLGVGGKKDTTMGK